MTEEQEKIIEEIRNIRFFLKFVLIFTIPTLLLINIGQRGFDLINSLIGTAYAFGLAAFLDIIYSSDQNRKPHWIVWFFLPAPAYHVMIVFIYFVVVFK